MLESLIQKNLIEEDEGKAKKNCFMLYARDLSITWAESQTNKYWSWFSDLDQTSSDVRTEVAKMERVAWLEVVGKFETEKLTPNSLYEVVFVVKLIDSAKGWDFRVNFKLVLPTGETKERRENVNLLERNKWVEIPAGEFMISPEHLSGKIEFSMLEVKSDQWKSGLIVKGVAIRPKN
ncbi:lectin-like protein [Arabidopsis thaliana]|uniref:Lectin-like protein n=1 Tax=Arabidopsis thaliana TaxID=3702 RepID=A0A2H1ZEP0_ARATH|nr:lectin-like protein [Arabidopsis thaliana]AEE84233.2 lectin-like protein [Arabidopsis thaliana]|eukprot:NP_001320001.1 lectin-like protein [Arabidopsis thaliana]